MNSSSEYNYFSGFHCCLCISWFLFFQTGFYLEEWSLFDWMNCAGSFSLLFSSNEIVFIYTSPSSFRAISTDILDPFSPPIPIVHCFRQVFRVTSCINTDLLYVCSSWSPCLCSTMWRGPQEYIAYELVPTSPAASRMSGLSTFDSFRNRW